MGSKPKTPPAPIPPPVPTTASAYVIASAEEEELRKKRNSRQKSFLTFEMTNPAAAPMQSGEGKAYLG